MKKVLSNLSHNKFGSFKVLCSIFMLATSMSNLHATVTHRVNWLNLSNQSLALNGNQTVYQIFDGTAGQAWNSIDLSNFTDIPVADRWMFQGISLSLAGDMLVNLIGGNGDMMEFREDPANVGDANFSTMQFTVNITGVQNNSAEFGFDHGTRPISTDGDGNAMTSGEQIQITDQTASGAGNNALANTTQIQADGATYTQVGQIETFSNFTNTDIQTTNAALRWSSNGYTTGGFTVGQFSVGNANNSRFRRFVITVVPEPSSALLLLSSLFAFSRLRRREIS